MKKPQVGSVSTGTLITADLLGAFIAELAAFDSKRAAKFQKEADAIPGSINEDGDAARELLDEVTDALDEIAARAGLRFGAHEGDGADFGFWPVFPDEPGARDMDGAPFGRVFNSRDLPGAFDYEADARGEEIRDASDDGDQLRYGKEQS